jgi:hypothetical protein
MLAANQDMTTAGSVAFCLCSGEPDQRQNALAPLTGCDQGLPSQALMRRDAVDPAHCVKVSVLIKPFLAAKVDPL